MASAPGGPLADLLVLDLTRALAGPHAAMMLGDLGARVIKVEPPAGDDTRSWGPPFVGPEDGSADRESTYFLSANRNKESLVLDLKSPDDCEVLARLIARADVLMENYRVGVLDRLGFPVSRLHELNPRLVVLSITGFGHDGPEAKRAGYDQIAQGEGGLMSITGTSQPTKVGVPIADLIAGMNGAYGVLAALYERASTGRGRVVRTSLLAGMIGVHAFQGTRWTVAGEVPASPATTTRPSRRTACSRRRARRSRSRAGPRVCGATLCAALGWDPAADGLATNPERVANRDELIGKLEAHFAGSPAEHWLALLVGGRRSLGQGPHDGRRLLVGPGAVAGTAPRRRALDSGCHPAARLTAALRRQRPLRRPAVARRPADPRPAQRVDPGVARLMSRNWHDWYRMYDDPTRRCRSGLRPSDSPPRPSRCGGRPGSAAEPLCR